MVGRGVRVVRALMSPLGRERPRFAPPMTGRPPASCGRFVAPRPLGAVARGSVRRVAPAHAGRASVLSFHIAEAGGRDALRLLRRPLTPAAAQGLRYAAATLATAPSGSSSSRRRRIALVAAWDGADDVERFDDGHPYARALRDGWRATMLPLRTAGAGSPLLDALGDERADAGGGPIAVLTFGRLRVRRAARFMRLSPTIERLASAHGGLLAATVLVRPPLVVGTLTLWQDLDAMRAFAHGRDEHRVAMRADREDTFFRAAAFVRMRPHRSRGAWDGRDPLAAPS